MEKNKNVPKLRFPEFSGEWEEKKYCEIIIEGKLGGNYENSESNIGIPVIKMGNIGRGNIVLGKIQYLPENENYNNDDILKEGDLLFNTRNTLELVGKVSIWRCELPLALYNSNLLRMIFNDQIESSNRFMNYSFNSIKIIKQLRAFATGTTSVAAIYGKDLEHLKIYIPSTTEQTKIATFLTAVDEKLTQLKKKKTLLEQYKKGVMQKLFSQELRFKDNNNQDFPDWQEKTLGEVCDIKGGKRIPKGYLLQSENNGYPYITISDMKEGTVLLENIQFVPIDVIDQIKNYTISTSDIYISVAGTLGLVGIIPKELENANLTENANKLTKLKCDQTFLYQFLTGDHLKKLIENVKTIGAQPKLAIYALNDFNLSLPSLPEQQKIATFLSSIDEKISHSSAQIEKMEAWKKGLLQQMFC